MTYREMKDARDRDVAATNKRDAQKMAVIFGAAGPDGGAYICVHQNFTVEKKRMGRLNPKALAERRGIEHRDLAPAATARRSPAKQAMKDDRRARRIWRREDARQKRTERE